jgi:hypothetical protein
MPGELQLYHEYLVWEKLMAVLFVVAAVDADAVDADAVDADAAAAADTESAKPTEPLTVNLVV